MKVRELVDAIVSDIRINLYVEDISHHVCITRTQWYGGLAPYMNNEIAGISFENNNSYDVEMNIIMKGSEE